MNEVQRVEEEAPNDNKKQKQKKKKRKLNEANKGATPTQPPKQAIAKNTSTRGPPRVTDTEWESNEYLDVFNTAKARYPEDMDRILDPDLDDDRRVELFDMLEPDWPEEFAWAVPTDRALRIISHFAPLVEVGCGTGYWGGLLKKRGVEYVGYDVVAPKGRKWCDVKKGGPAVVARHPTHTLLLSYPDDFERGDESLALQCLERFTSDTIILIGELFGANMLPNPWGRSCGADFQETLASQFHCVIRIPLPSQPLAKDTLTVWKRNKLCLVDDMTFNVIPAGERLPQEAIAPDFAHLC